LLPFSAYSLLNASTGCNNDAFRAGYNPATIPASESEITATAADALAEVDRVLTGDDPSAAFAALPAEHREAIRRKELSDGMSPRAVEMAWGQPERRRIDRPARTEEWAWPGGKRRASFNDEKLVRWER